MVQSEIFSWINEGPHIPQPINPVQKPNTGYRPRKSHTKSRNGCNNCRKRRIKCDEARPSCGQCSNRLLGSLQCDFFTPQKPAEGDHFQLPAQNSLGNISNTVARDQIMSYLENSGVPCKHFKDPIYKPGDALEFLNHFLDVQTPWIGSPPFQRIIQQYGLELSLKAPYLMHAIIAFSASHLHYLHREEKKYSIAFALHYALSLSGYSSELRATLNPSNADAIIASSYLHTMLAFRNVQPQPKDNPDVDTDVGRGLTWLRAMRGVSILWGMSDMRSLLKGSIMLNMENDREVSIKRTSGHYKPYEANPWALEASKALLRLFEVDCDQYTFKNSYEGPLGSLSQLMRPGTGRDTVCAFMSFVGDLPTLFIQLLDHNDPRALLILCYWSAMLSQIDYWWVVDPATFVCRELCAYLERIPQQEIHDLLQFPASKCGYTIGYNSPLSKDYQVHRLPSLNQENSTAEDI